MEHKMHSLLIFVSHQIPYLYPAYKVSLQTGRLKAKGRVLGMRGEQNIFVSGSQASVTSDFRVEGFHCIMFSGHFCIITTTISDPKKGQSFWANITGSPKAAILLLSSTLLPQKAAKDLNFSKDR